jgi:hypothetical protein
MRKFFLMLLIAGGILSIEGSPASAVPANGSAIASALKSNSLIQDVRLYCYNRYTGRFLHGGHVGVIVTIIILTIATTITITITAAIGIATIVIGKRLSS